MPIISAYTDHPTRPYVRVEINWADIPAVTHAGVYRVDVATGECTPLRPYICYDGWELLLSCGHGIFWDTEAPFDAPFYYVTTSSEAPCLPAEPLFLDTFARTLVDDWGSTESGTLSPLPYVLSGGTNPGNYDVNGGKGRMTIDSVNVDRTAVVDLGSTNFDLYASLSTDQVATGAALTTRVVARFTDANNHYQGGVNWDVGGGLLAFITRINAGVQTLLAIDLSVGTYAPGVEWTLRFQGHDTRFRLKAWLATDPEPEDWLLEVTDTVQPLTDTRVGILARADVGNTNVSPILSTDDFMDLEPCAPCDPVTVDTSATPTTIANDGGFWLKDPVRPCNDQPVPLCSTSVPSTPGCGADGILFIGIGAEIYPSNSFSLRPMNRRRTIAVTRPRGDATTSLRLQTLTFTDREELLQLVIPGTPLLFQGPSEYGIPDRYMDIRDVQISPELPDLRIQIRSVTLPYNTVDRPAGPTQGICGARVADICDLYPTWDALAAAGFTWDDLIRGAADPAVANPLRRTWDDVNAEFADWDAVNTGGRTWTGLLEGD